MPFAVLTLLLATPNGSPMTEAYRRAEQFGSPRLGRLVYNLRLEPRWIDGGPRFWYRTDVRGERRFVLVDPDAGSRAPAFDHDALAAALSTELGRTIDAARLPFGEIEWVNGGLRFDTGGVRYQFAGGALSTIEPAPQTPAPPATEEPAQPERGTSPDGRWVAFDRDHNVWLRPTDGGEPVQLTTFGAAEGSFSLVDWSPDSRRLVLARTVPGDRLNMFLVEAKPEDSFRPRLRQHRYDLPGDKVDTHELHLCDVATRALTPVATELIDWGGPPDPRWRPDGVRFTFEQEHRGYQRFRIVEVDSLTGAARAVLEERSATFLAPMKRWIRYLDGGREILFTSERSGWNHLYRLNGETGELLNAITAGEWVVRDVVDVDEQARTIRFTAGGREPGQSPYLRHHYRVGFDGTNLVRLTDGDGDHEVTFTPDGRYLIDTYSRVDQPPIHTLRRASDGGLVGELERADITDLLATGWRLPEPFVAKGRDGVTDIWGVIHRPSTLDETRRYPLVESIYAGPQGSAIPAGFHLTSDVRALAELGFVTVQIDGMGMSGRSKAFHDVAWHNLGDSGFPDRILWMRAAAARYPYLDVTRVGLYGVSAGGYNAARALIAANDFYSVACAIAGNHDHRTDKVWWNELWMGYPVGPHYEEQSNVSQAARLRGKLLLVHGELDDNVNPSAASQQLAGALMRANKDFDMLLVPGLGHGLNDYVKRRLWDHFVRHLLGADPPFEYAIAPTSGSEVNVVFRNALTVPVVISWVTGDGGRRKYHDLAPGAEVRQHTYVGHEWEAEADGRVVSRFAAERDGEVWTIAGE